MKPVIVLDSTPLGLVTQRPGVLLGDECRRWLVALRRAGYPIRVPEIADYEVRRELLRASKTKSVARLDAFLDTRPLDYLPITTAVMRHAALLWAQARQQGRPTAPDPALDGDMILCAQATAISAAPGDVIVATSNPAHLDRFVSAKRWDEIEP